MPATDQLFHGFVTAPTDRLFRRPPIGLHLFLASKANLRHGFLAYKALGSHLSS